MHVSFQSPSICTTNMCGNDTELYELIAAEDVLE